MLRLHGTLYHERTTRSQEPKAAGATRVRSQVLQFRQSAQLGWNSPVEIIAAKRSAQVTQKCMQKWESGSVSYEGEY